MIEYESLEEELRYNPHAWRDYANCLGATEEDDRLLFPWESNPEPSDNETDLYMIKHCFECPVRAQCLNFAAKTNSVGIWGGFRLNFRDSSKLEKLRRRKGSITVEDAEEALGRKLDAEVHYRGGD